MTKNLAAAKRPLAIMDELYSWMGLASIEVSLPLCAMHVPLDGTLGGCRPNRGGGGVGGESASRPLRVRRLR